MAVKKKIVSKPKMRSGGKIKRYQDAGTTENRSSEDKPKVMTNQEFKDAKKAKKQQNKLDRNLGDEIQKGSGVVLAATAAIEGVRRLLNKEKKGGTTMKKGGITKKKRK